MNKKLIGFTVVIVIAVIGIGFMFLKSNKKIDSNNSNISSDTNIQEDDHSNTSNKEDNKLFNRKVAVIYFSATGTTKKVAEYIKDATNGDLIEIVPKEKYTDADLNYNNDNCRANKEQNDSSSRPEISNNINTDSYDIIYLGYPIWWGDAPKIILSFLDSHNLNGKIVIPFCTSGSSTISASVNYFKNNYTNIHWLDGRRLNASKNEVTNWINKLDY